MFVKTKNIDLIKLDLNCLLFLFYFISFGIYGALTPSVSMIAKNLLYHVLFEILILVIPILYYFYLNKFKRTLVNIYLNYRIILIIIIFTMIFIFWNIYPLTYGLFSDEQSYVMSAHEHARKVILKISNMTNLIDNISINYLTRLLSLAICCYIILNTYIFQKLSLKYLLIYVYISIILFRIIFIGLGGHMSPHPTINLIPSLFSGTFFGFSPVVFKASILMIFIIWCFCTLKRIPKINSWFLYYTLILIVLTLPIVNELKHTVEPALWTFMLFVYIGISLLHNGYKNYNKQSIKKKLFL